MMPARDPLIGRWMSKLYRMGAHAYGSVHGFARRVATVIFELSCLLIRNTARFLIRMQAARHSKSQVPAASTYGFTGPDREESWVADAFRDRQGLLVLIITGAMLAAFAFGWFLGSTSYELRDHGREELTGKAAVDAVVERIIAVESNGDPNAKNKRSSATGLGQFLNETWLGMIRAYRPDLVRGRNESEILELRRDAKLSREITTRFAERNAAMLKQRGLPVTPGNIYLAHFAGGAGAVAILSALEHADAAFVMASADATGQAKRDRIVKANPFLERFTIADLKKWADRKMHGPLLHVTELAPAGVQK
jgi:hypothetical protein